MQGRRVCASDLEGIRTPSPGPIPTRKEKPCVARKKNKDDPRQNVLSRCAILVETDEMQRRIHDFARVEAQRCRAASCDVVDNIALDVRERVAQQRELLSELQRVRRNVRPKGECAHKHLPPRHGFHAPVGRVADLDMRSVNVAQRARSMHKSVFVDDVVRDGRRIQDLGRVRV